MRSMTGMSSNDAMAGPQRSRRSRSTEHEGGAMAALITGLDLGGAHLKAAQVTAGRPRGRARCSCPAPSGRASTGSSGAWPKPARSCSRRRPRRGHHDRRAGRPLPRPADRRRPAARRRSPQPGPAPTARSGPGAAASSPLADAAAPAPPTIASANWLASATLVGTAGRGMACSSTSAAPPPTSWSSPAARCAPRASPTASGWRPASWSTPA